MPDLNNKVCVVTGAASGIGRAAAVKLAASGAKAVVAADIDEAGARETVKRIEAAGGTASAKRTDVEEPDQSTSSCSTPPTSTGRWTPWSTTWACTRCTGPTRRPSTSSRSRSSRNLPDQPAVGVHRDPGRGAAPARLHQRPHDHQRRRPPAPSPATRGPARTGLRRRPSSSSPASRRSTWRRTSG